MKKKLIYIFLSLLVIVASLNFLHFFSTPTEFNANVCSLKKLSVKAKVSRMIEGKVLLFEIDSLLGDYYLRQSIFSKTECDNCAVSNSEYHMRLGDSIIKAANSKIIKFKRGDTSYVVNLDDTGCE